MRMTRKSTGNIRLVLVAAAALLLGSCGYNTMQQYEEAVFAAWGNLESSLQRRADLVPNLVATVQGAAEFERETLEAVIQARANATSMQISPEMLDDADALQRFQEAQSELSQSLGRLMVVVEQYPQLQANQNFRDLQNQLEGTENRINVARQRYNEAVERFNTSIRRFPNSLTNSILLNLDRKEYFAADEGAAAAPRVEF